MNNFEKLSRAQMKNVIGGRLWYRSTDDNPTATCPTGDCEDQCIVTCTQQTSSDNGQTWQNNGVGPCTTYAICEEQN